MLAPAGSSQRSTSQSNSSAGGETRATAKAGGGIDELRLVRAGDERGRVGLDVGEEP